MQTLQKEINAASDSLQVRCLPPTRLMAPLPIPPPPPPRYSPQRAFATTDEAIFRSATKDEGSKLCYKGLAYMHDAFGQLVSNSQEIGAVAIAERQLRSKADELSARNTAEAIEKISGDLKQLRAQNDELTQK